MLLGEARRALFEIFVFCEQTLRSIDTVWGLTKRAAKGPLQPRVAPKPRPRPWLPFAASLGWLRYFSGHFTGLS